MNDDRAIELLKKDTIGRCEKCKKTGYLDYSLCECNKKFQAGVKLLLGGFPLDLLRMKKPKDIFDIQKINFFIKNPQEVYDNGLSLYIHGPLGVGKTFCSVWLAEEFVSAFSPEGLCEYKYDLKVTFMEASQFVMKSRLYNNEELKEFYKTFDSNLFVLDDLSNEYKSQANPQYVDKLYEMFLRHRISHCLATIITSNVKPSDVENKYNEKIASLMGIKQTKIDFEMAGRFAEVQLEGPDCRKIKEITQNIAWGEHAI